MIHSFMIVCNLFVIDRVIIVRLYVMVAALLFVFFVVCEFTRVSGGSNRICRTVEFCEADIVRLVDYKLFISACTLTFCARDLPAELSV